MISKLEWLELRKQNKKILDELAELRYKLGNRIPSIPDKKVVFPLYSTATVLPRVLKGRIRAGRFGVEFASLSGYVGKMVKITIEPYEGNNSKGEKLLNDA